MPDAFEYRVVSKWTGWWGGWGSERDIAAIASSLGREGWRLVRSESSIFLWWLLPIFPRKKLLLIFERPLPVAPVAENAAFAETLAPVPAASTMPVAPSIASEELPSFVRRS